MPDSNNSSIANNRDETSCHTIWLGVALSICLLFLLFILVSIVIWILMSLFVYLSDILTYLLHTLK